MIKFHRFKGVVANFPRLLKCVEGGVLTKQGNGSCVPDHKVVVRAAAGISPRVLRFRGFGTVSHDVPNEATVRRALEKWPCLFLADGIAQPGSTYVGCHAIALIQMIDRDRLLVVDRDDTLGNEKPPEFVFAVSLSDLLGSAKKYDVNCATGVASSSQDADNCLCDVLSRPI